MYHKAYSTFTGVLRYPFVKVRGCLSPDGKKQSPRERRDRRDVEGRVYSTQVRLQRVRGLFTSERRCIRGRETFEVGDGSGLHGVLNSPDLVCRVKLLFRFTPKDRSLRSYSGLKKDPKNPCQYLIPGKSPQIEEQKGRT